VTLGRYGFIGAGTVVTEVVPEYALILDSPGRQKGWMSRHGHMLRNPSADGVMTCSESGLRYKEIDGRLSCLDRDEEAPLPPELAIGSRSYHEIKLWTKGLEFFCGRGPVLSLANATGSGVRNGYVS
jgi:UDP-2-acetamido-3-amino-2,3-dideoxy-glucuronate N-acetyltransferase